MLDISVVVPTKNAHGPITTCLQAIRRNDPREVIVVDGLSTDGTPEIAAALSDRVISDDGNGVAWARHLGAEVAASRYVAFIDVDIELPDEVLSLLLDEMQSEGAHAIQANLVSVDSGDYWSRALASHHNNGRSRRWFGLACTLFEREFFLQNDLDPAFKTGEDIELRHRLQNAGKKVMVSKKVTVTHRFDRGWEFALNQWLMDGAGLGRMIRKFGPKEMGLLFMPAGGMILGVSRSLPRGGRYVPYYLLYMVFNYVGIFRGLISIQSKTRRSP